MKRKQTQMETLKNIQNLQQLEDDLQRKLDTSVAGKSLSKKEQQKIIEKMKEISAIRRNLYSNLNQMYKRVQGDVARNRNQLVNQMVTSGIIENELKNAKNSYKTIEDNRNNKLRMVEINNYFGSRYRAYSNLMKQVIYFSIPILILAFLTRKELVPTKIAGGIVSLIIAVAILVLGRQILDLGMRDNMNFDEYNWYFNPNNVELDNFDDSDINDHPDFFDNGKNSSSQYFAELEGQCIGEQCCGPNMKYDSSKKRCVSNKEAVDILQKTTTKKKKNSIEAFTKNETFASF